MENKNIIIILVVIIIILALVMGITFLNPTNAKEPTKIKITSDKEQYDGGVLSIKLTDLNKTPISKENVNITITNSKGKVVFDDVAKTDSKGKAKIDLNLKKGKYTVNVTYGGNKNYTGNNTTQKLTIKEKVEKTPSSEVSQTADSSSEDNHQNSISRVESKIGPNGREYGTIYDDEGREYIYADQGGYVNVLDENGNGVSLDYDGNVIGHHTIG